MPKRRKTTKNSSDDCKKEILNCLKSSDSDAESSSKNPEPSSSAAVRMPSCDFYCIVEISEANQKFLIAIPHKWLRENFIHWPNYIKEENIRSALSDGASEPKKGWWQKPCILKRQGFLSKIDADIEISNMSGILSTEPSKSNEPLPLAEFRTIVRQELQPVVSQLKAGMEKLDKQIEKMNAVLFKKTSEISTQLCSAASPQKQHGLHTNSLRLSNTNLYDLSEFSFEIISDIEKLNELESKLKNDTTYKQQFICYMSQYCGRNNDMHGKGWDASYTVIDRIWTRQFLTLFSWTGSSTSEKFEFRVYSAVIAAFFEIIFNADNAFTITEAEKFLRQQLKNSKKRASLKFARIGRKKTKRKSSANNSIIEKVKQDEGNESDDDYLQYKNNAANDTDHQFVHSEDVFLSEDQLEDEIKDEVQLMKIL